MVVFCARVGRGSKFIWIFTVKYSSTSIGKTYDKMSLVTKKPVFGVSNQVRHKPACAATEASQGIEISDIETRDNILSR